MNKSLSRLLLGGALILAAPLLAWGFVFILNDNTNLPYLLDSGATPIVIKLGNTKTLSDGTNYNTSAQAAANTWNAQIGAIQLSAQLQAAGTATQNNRVNELVFDSTVFGKDFEANTLAVTTVWTAGNTRTEGDIVFNSAHTWDSYRGNARAGSVDIQRVALHELGHLLGLDHPDEAGQTPSPAPIMNSRIGNRDTLAADDITGAQKLYGPPGVPTNDAFASASTLNPISGTPLTVTGYNTNATKELGEPRHAGEGGGRSIWWKWLAPSAGTVAVDTRNSYFDTLLGVYTGNTVATLTWVASNDDIDFENPIPTDRVQASSVTFTATAGTTYYFAVDGFDGECAGVTLTLNFTSTGPSVPVITTQPSSQTITVGQNVTFNVEATSSTPITYQWLFNNAPLTGATSNSLTVSNAQSTQAGAYTVTLTNSAGSVTSTAANLTVNAAPIVTPPPPAPAPAPSGGGGGGGAPSLWFLAALGALGLARRRGLRR